MGEHFQRGTDKTIDEILGYLAAAHNANYFGEKLSQLAHCLQCAKLATDAGADEEVILAALLHDVGHLCASVDDGLMGEWGIARHESVGANYLRERGFSERIAQLVEGHVEAKRYLTWKSDQYRLQLSPASIKTLAYQGGPFNREEAEEFEKSPLFREKLRLRSWDEQAKKVDLEVPQLETYRSLLFAHLASSHK